MNLYIAIFSPVHIMPPAPPQGALQLNCLHSSKSLAHNPVTLQATGNAGERVGTNEWPHLSSLSTPHLRAIGRLLEGTYGATAWAQMSTSLPCWAQAWGTLQSL